MASSYAMVCLIACALLFSFLIFSLQHSTQAAKPFEIPPKQLCGKRRQPWVIKQPWDKTLRENKNHPVRFVHGHPPFRMKLRPSTFDERMWMRLLTEQEYIFQVAVMDMIVRKVVPPSQQCGAVDIGANAGYISLVAASLGCGVDALEASPATAENAQRSFSINDEIGNRIRLHHAAVSKTRGSVAFASLRGGSIYDRMVSDDEAVKIVEKTDGVFGKFSVTRVPTKPVHELIHSKVVHFLKLDCEGCEAQAIETMAPLLERGDIKVILAEWITTRIRKVSGAESIPAVVDLLTKTGYQLYGYDGQPLSMSFISDLKTEVGDLFIVHKSVAKFTELINGNGGVLETWQELKQCHDSE